mmetsp:Transcript_33111/g.55426  ORF Transcript_33111/g.55426 Transcript_33111/m.55426 type:complete len:237 (-) Transcript_33111:745-1455(-)
MACLPFLVLLSEWPTLQHVPPHGYIHRMDSQPQHPLTTIHRGEPRSPPSARVQNRASGLPATEQHGRLMRLRWKPMDASQMHLLRKQPENHPPCGGVDAKTDLLCHSVGPQLHARPESLSRAPSSNRSKVCKKLQLSCIWGGGESPAAGHSTPLASLAHPPLYCPPPSARPPSLAPHCPSARPSGSVPLPPSGPDHSSAPPQTPCWGSRTLRWNWGSDAPQHHGISAPSTPCRPAL